MSATAHIASATQTTQVAPPSPVAASSSTSAQTSSASAQVAAQSSSSSNATISPRITVDPSAGVIIQYLGSNGQVQNQIPSETVVAYLKAGLTADGLQKPESPQQQQNA